MGILDKARDKAKDALSKAHEMAEEHADQMKAGIDKAENLANKATKGKFADKIEAIGEKAAAVVPSKEAEEAAAPASAPAAEATAPTPAAEPAVEPATVTEEGTTQG